MFCWVRAASKRAREEDSGLQGGDGAEGAMEVESDEPARASKSVQVEQVKVGG